MWSRGIIFGLEVDGSTELLLKGEWVLSYYQRGVFGGLPQKCFWDFRLWERILVDPGDGFAMDNGESNKLLRSDSGVRTPPILPLNRPPTERNADGFTDLPQYITYYHPCSPNTRQPRRPSIQVYQILQASYSWILQGHRCSLLLWVAQRDTLQGKWCRYFSVQK